MLNNKVRWFILKKQLLLHPKILYPSMLLGMLETMPKRLFSLFLITQFYKRFLYTKNSDYQLYIIFDCLLSTKLNLYCQFNKINMANWIKSLFIKRLNNKFRRFILKKQYIFNSQKCDKINIMLKHIHNITSQ